MSRRAEQQVAVALGDVAEARGERVAAQLCFGHVDGAFRQRREPPCPVFDDAVEVRVRDRAVHGAPRGGALRIEALAQQHRFARARRADLVLEPRDGAPREWEAQLHFGELELRRLGGDPEVAGQRENGAAADRMAVDARDRDGLAVLDRPTRAQPELERETALPLAGARVGAESLVTRRTAPVGPAAERRTPPAEDHDAGREVALEAREERGDFLERRGVERVAALGPRQPDAQDGAVALRLESLPAHRQGSRFIPCAACR